jgi:hypothetical protein
MKVRMLKLQVGPTVRRLPSEVVDLPTDEAQRMIAAGVAEAVAEPPQKKARKAVKKKAEKRG